MRAPRSLRFLIAGALALAAARLAAAETPTAAGHWEGAIQIPGTALEVRVDLATGEGSAWKGDIDIPAQNAKDLPLSAIQVEGSSVSFAIAGIPGAPTFKGTLAADGQSLGGDFSQGGQTFSFKLERKPEPAQTAARTLDGLPAFIQGVIKDWKIPGLAVAVVKDDQVVFCEGFGLRDVKQNLPVTRDTLFAIGSSSKAFTVMSLGLLVEDGKLEWDRPVRNSLPTFRLKDTVASERITPRDLVTHRSGLPRHDLVWYNSTLSRREIVDRLQYLEPNADFRERWQYQNLMFLTAGYLAGEMAGTSWEELVRTRIFGPLHMTNSNFSVQDSQKSADFALPYNEKDKALQEIPFRDITNMAPAGSINSSVVDMAQWVRLHLGRGKFGDKRIISEAAVGEMHKAQMVMTDPVQDTEITNRSYAMGWFVESYRGRVRVHHGGNIDGFSALVSLTPREGFGIVVLTNRDGNPAPEIVTRQVTDRLLGLEPVDWNARLLLRRDTAEKAGEKAAANADLDRKKGTRPVHPFEDYVGDYEHPAYGVIGVGRDGTAALKASFHAIPMRLEHWHYDTFRALPDDKALADEKLFAQFLTNAKGDVDRLSVLLEPNVPEIVFVKKPPARLSDPAFLKTLVGTFALADNPTVTVTFALKGDKALTATIPGQPQYELIPYQGSDFRLKGLTGYSVRFVVDAKGAVSEAFLIQPDGVYAAKRK